MTIHDAEHSRTEERLIIIGVSNKNRLLVGTYTERGKYAQALREQGYTIRVYEADGTYSETRVLGEKTVLLEPDVWEYFPDSQSVNRALRALIAIAPAKREAAVREEKAAYQTTAKKKNRLKN